MYVSLNFISELWSCHRLAKGVPIDYKEKHSDQAGTHSKSMMNQESGS